MFEDRTFENILAEMLAMAPEGTDTRQGSVFYDHVAPAAFKIAKLYSDLSITIELTSIDTAEGIYLDEKCKEHGIERIPATANVRNATFVGAEVTANQRFFASNQYFITQYDDEGNIVVVAETPGEAPNSIPAGTALVPVVTIPGLTEATLGETITPGSEEESDDNLRRRLQEKIAGPAANGNKQHYKTWCEEVAGVKLARIDPLWAGPNTVRGILIDNEGLPVSQGVVDEVQNYIDPGSTGLGEGVANIGAIFTAVAAEEYIINVSFSAQLDAGVSVESVIQEATEEIKAYLKEISLANQENTSTLVRLSAIANVIYSLSGVIDYTDLTINDGTANISVPYTAVPVLGVVSVEQL